MEALWLALPTADDVLSTIICLTVWRGLGILYVE